MGCILHDLIDAMTVVYILFTWATQDEEVMMVEVNEVLWWQFGLLYADYPIWGIAVAKLLISETRRIV